MSKSKKPPRLQFKPTNLTTEVGSASYDPTTGNVSSTLDPQLAALRDLFWNDAMSFAPSDEQQAFAENVGTYGMGLFNRAANLDTNQMAQDYYNQQQSNLAPTRALEEARLGDTLFKSGRTGAATGYMGGGYINPEQFSLAMGRAQADNQMLLGAEDRARLIQQQDIANSGQYLNLANALQLQPYQNVAGITDLGIGISNQATNLLSPLQGFANTQFNWQTSKNQNDAARASASGGGFLSGLGGGLLGSASQVLGQGLGQWALNTYLPGAGTALGAIGGMSTNPASGAGMFLR